MFGNFWEDTSGVVSKRWRVNRRTLAILILLKGKWYNQRKKHFFSPSHNSRTLRDSKQTWLLSESKLSRHSPCHVSHNNWTSVSHIIWSRAHVRLKKVQEGITIIAFKLQAYKFRQRIRRERMSSTASWLVSFIISHIHHSISIFFFEYNKLIINLYSPNESEILFASVAHQSSRQGHFYFNNWKVTIT